MNARPILSAAPALLALTLAGAAAPTLLGNVVVSEWTNSNNFHHKRVGVPDQDQVRVGLPNSGNCYCVPTSMMNMMMYIANHGYPQVTPGPGDYSGYDTYYEITNLLETLGAEASISPGGDDPDDPDCTSDGEGNGTPDGECSDLPCGGGILNTFNAMTDLGWFGSAKNKLVYTARFLDPNAPAVTFPNLAQLGNQGNILVFAYGRYKPVGSFQGQTIYKRDGGHCVTMNEAYASGATKLLYSRDPGQHDGDIFGPSPYTSNMYTVTEETVLVSESPEGGFLTWTSKTFPGLNEPHGDGKKRLLDSYFAIRPKTGVFWKDYISIQTLSLSLGFGGTPDPDPFPTNFAANDLVLDQDLIGWYVLTAANEVQTAQLLHINPFEEEPVVFEEDTDADRLVLGRLNDLYTISSQSATLRRYNCLSNLLKTVQLAGPPSAIVYDDNKDRVYVLIPGSTGFGGTLWDFPRIIGSEVDPVLTWQIGPNVHTGQGCRMAINPTDGRLWISSPMTGTASGFMFDAAGFLVQVEGLAGFPNLTGIEFDDSGALFLMADGSVKVFERQGPGNQWLPGDAGAFEGVEVGTMIRIARSRSNFDPSIHDVNAWRNIDTDELLAIGTPVPDCFGDLNGDGIVDGADLGELLADWMGGPGPSDLDGSGDVDGADLGLLLAAFGPCP